MSNIEKIRQEIDRRYEENREKARYDDYYRGMNDGLDSFESFLDTLPEDKPIEKDEEMEALIACDIMEATVKRVNIDKQDKDKEEEAMLEKINYLRNLGLNE